MRKRLFSRAFSWPPVRRLRRWGRDLHFYWLTCHKENVAFLFVLALPLVVLGLLLYRSHMEASRMEAKRQRNTDLICLARNIYFEARGEPMEGQYAVAEVTLNRVASPRFPDTICDVVYEKRWDYIRKRYVGAFSWTELYPNAMPTGIPWGRAVTAAQAVYDNQESPRVEGALFYHARRIRPRWAKTKEPVARIGRHIFYQ